MDLGGLIASYSVVSLALQSALEIFVTNLREPAKANGVHQITQAYDDFARPQNPPQK
ncbi:MAG: hypothetical protein HC890_00765 [Chloroflexaceae bacterium]|nr:hypothetical protein [Chloroflexaceae bacterium]